MFNLAKVIFGTSFVFATIFAFEPATGDTCVIITNEPCRAAPAVPERFCSAQAPTAEACSGSSYIIFSPPTKLQEVNPFQGGVVAEDLKLDYDNMRGCTVTYPCILIESQDGNGHPTTTCGHDLSGEQGGMTFVPGWTAKTRFGMRACNDFAGATFAAADFQR